MRGRCGRGKLPEEPAHHDDNHCKVHDNLLDREREECHERCILHALGKMDRPSKGSCMQRVMHFVVRMAKSAEAKGNRAKEIGLRTSWKSSLFGRACSCPREWCTSPKPDSFGIPIPSTAVPNSQAAFCLV